MGLLSGLFRKKEERTHFVRDAGGRVVDVQRSNGNGGGKSGTPISDALLSQQPKKVSRWKNMAEERKLQRRLEREAYQESYHKARISSAKARGREMGGMTLGDRVDRMTRGMGGTGGGYSTQGNYNPFGSMFDSGMKPMKSPAVKRKKTSGGVKGSKSSPKYAVVGGKAYPIAGTKKGKKKVGKRKKSGGMGFGGFDMTDNWGFMK